MQLTEFRPLYADDTALLTACLDVTRDSENGAEELRLRWEALAEDLPDVPEAVLAAAADRMLAETGLGGQWSRTVIVGDDGVRREDLTAGAARPFAHYGPFPRLAPLIAAEEAWVDHLLVEIDRTGADLRLTAREGEWTATIDGPDEPVHKASAGGWSHMQWQHHIEDLWERNAAEVAERVERIATRSGVKIIAIAGDVRSANLLRDALPPTMRDTAHVLDGGGRGEKQPPGRLPGQLTSLIEAHALARARGTAERLGEAGGHGMAVSGLADTVAALRRAQVDTLLLPPDWDGEVPAAYGPDPMLLALADADLGALGVDRPDHAPVGDLMVRAAVCADSAASVIPEHVLDLHGEPAAILRFTDDSTAR